MSSGEEMQARWFVCHTKPRCEKRFADLLADHALEHYLPLYQSRHFYHNPRLNRTEVKKFTKPLFPSYVFCRLPLNRKSDAYQRDYVVRLLLVENENRFLQQLEAIQRLIAAGVELELCPPLEKGVRVRITRGPLMGVQALVDDPADPKGIVVAVDILRQGVLTRIPKDDLEVLEEE